MKRFFLIFLSSFIVCLCMFSHPLSLYFEQKYQYLIPQSLKKSFALQASNNFLEIFKPKKIQKQNDSSLSDVEQIFKELERRKQKHKLANNTVADLKHNTALEANSTVLIIGDSLMQGISYSLVKYLKDKNLNVINLSKPSTGLNNKEFYNWENVLRSEINRHDISLVIAMFGTNDAWSVYEKGVKLKFADEKWIEFYTKRVDEILNIIKQSKSNLAWIGLPCMKTSKFDDKMQILNEIYEKQVKENNYIFIDIKNNICKDGKYLKFIHYKNKNISIRHSDGIHFSTPGNDMVSKLIVKSLKQ